MAKCTTMARVVVEVADITLITMDMAAMPVQDVQTTLEIGSMPMYFGDSSF